MCRQTRRTRRACAPYRCVSRTLAASARAASGTGALVVAASAAGPLVAGARAGVVVTAAAVARLAFTGRRRRGRRRLATVLAVIVRGRRERGRAPAAFAGVVQTVPALALVVAVFPLVVLGDAGRRRVGGRGGRVGRLGVGLDGVGDVAVGFEVGDRTLGVE